jgi:DNA-directed RNA polymerase subunit RPC12/RpoP
MRLIDADALLNALNTYSDTENGNGHFLHGIKSAQEQIDDAPTIDAMPVVRGEWTYEHGAWACSKCGEDSPYGIDRKTVKFANYCPNCGAKMESEGST